MEEAWGHSAHDWVGARWMWWWEGGVGKIKSKKFIIKYMARPQTFMRLRVFNLTGKKLSLSGLVRTY